MKILEGTVHLNSILKYASSKSRSGMENEIFPEEVPGECE